jgi:hypothetical protein
MTSRVKESTFEKERMENCMRMLVIGITVIILLPMSVISMAHAEEGNRPPQREGRVKPPPEAIAACKGKSEGVAVQFTTPRGDTLQGVCKEFEGSLAAMPEQRAGGPPQGRPPDGPRGGQPED